MEKEDIEKIEKFVEIRNKGFYIDGAQVTEVYNRVLNKKVNVTNCGSCVRQRISELEDALNRFKASEALKKEEQTVTKEEENKAVTEARNEDIKARMARVRAAKGKK